MDVFRSFIRDLNIGHVVKIGKQLEPCNQSTFEIAKKYKVQLKEYETDLCIASLIKPKFDDRFIVDLCACFVSNVKLFLF